MFIPGVIPVVAEVRRVSNPGGSCSSSAAKRPGCKAIHMNLSDALVAPPPLASLKRLSIQGTAVSVFAQILRFAVQLAGTAVLARLLSPQDFGVVGMVTVATGILYLFSDPGLSDSTVQRESATQAQISAIFWLNVQLGLAMTLVGAALGPLLAAFYKMPALAPVSAAVSLSFLLGGFSAQHMALLRRQMRFVALASIELLAFAGGLAIGIVMAMHGFGYWSLVWTQVATGALTVVGAAVTSRWKPGLPARSEELRSLFAFGGNLTLFNCAGYCAGNLDNVLIGWRWGAAELGVYSKAYQLMMTPIFQVVVPIGKASIPALSRLQSSPERFRRYYLQAMQAIAFITLTGIALAVVSSNDLIRLVLGPHWKAVGPIFRILAIAALPQPLLTTVGWIYLALGRTKEMAQWGMLVFPALILSFIVGLPWGIRGVATAYAATMLLLSYPCVRLATRYTQISVRDVLGAVSLPAVMASIAGGTGLLLQFLTRHLDLMIRLPLYGGAGMLAAAAFGWLHRPTRAQLAFLLDLRPGSGTSIV
jgi:PST family polysaccharide transporter